MCHGEYQPPLFQTRVCQSHLASEMPAITAIVVVGDNALRRHMLFTFSINFCTGHLIIELHLLNDEMEVSSEVSISQKLFTLIE